MASLAHDGPGELTTRSATGVGVASLVAAAASYGVILAAAWTLEPARNADFLAFWALLFAVFGVLVGVQNETTRSIRAGFDAGSGARPGARVLPTALSVGAGLALALAVTSPWWSTPVLGGSDLALVGALCLAAFVFSGHAALAGSLGGTGRWNVYAGLIASEATLRLTLVVAVAVVGASAAGYELAAAAAAATWLVVVACSRSARAALLVRADVPTGAFVRRLGHAMVASASSAALVVGFPVLLRLTSTEFVYAASAPLLLAVSMTRAPLLIPLGAYQGVAITYFLNHRTSGVAALGRVALAIVGLGTFGAGLAYLVGPWLTQELIRPDYRVEGPLLAGLTFAAALLALLTLTGAAVLALDRHRAYATGWIAATVTSVLVLLVPLPVELRAVASLTAGPLVGIAVHARAVALSARAGR